MNIHNVEFIKSCVSIDGCPTGLPQVAFAGKSNVGKSSVINRVLLRKNFARVGEAPGKTTHINYFNIDEKMFLVDLPGYGYAKVSKAEKARWGILMDQYFGSGLIDYGVMIVDARHKPTANDMTMADCFKDAGRPFVVVANKLDKLKKSQIAGSMETIRLTLGLSQEIPVIPFSAEKGDGRDELIQFILSAIH